jgi:hypothetical protein
MYNFSYIQASSFSSNLKKKTKEPTPVGLQIMYNFNYVQASMAVDFNGAVAAAPLPTTASGASLTSLQPPNARFALVPPLHRLFSPS